VDFADGARRPRLFTTAFIPPLVSFFSSQRRKIRIDGIVRFLCMQDHQDER